MSKTNIYPEILEWIQDNWDDEWNTLTPQEIIEDLDEEENFRQPLANIFKEKMDVLVKALEDRINFEEQEKQIEQIEREEEEPEEEPPKPDLISRIGNFFRRLFR